jgi:hypothetical protein
MVAERRRPLPRSTAGPKSHPLRHDDDIDSDGSPQPSAQDLEGASFRGKRLAEIPIKLHG